MATSSVASAVGTDSLPLDKSEEVTEPGSFFQSGFYQQPSGGGQFGNPYGNNFQQPYQGGFLNNFQGAGYSGTNRGYSGYSAYPSSYSGFSSNLYNSGGFGQRALRRSRGGGASPYSKPVFIEVGKNVKSTIELIKFLPAIKGIQEEVEYFMYSGNSTLFEISQKGSLGYLHSRMPLAVGSYYLKIGSKLKGEGKSGDEAKLWFNKKKLNLKLVVKVV